MPFSVNQKQLSDSLKVLKRGIDSRPSHPILAGYLFELHGDKLKMTAVGGKGFDDNFSRVTVEIPAKGEVNQGTEVSAVVVPFRGVAEIVNSLPKGCDIELSMKEVLNPIDKAKVSYSVTVKTDFVSSFTEGMDPEQFPIVFDSASYGKLEEPRVASFPSHILASALKDTVVAASKDPFKKVLNGVNISDASNNRSGVNVAATNGHRLACVEYSFPLPEGFQLTVPYKVADSLSKLLGGNLKKLAQGGSSVTFSQQSKRVWQVNYVSDGVDTTFAFEEHSTPYPNYLQLFPDSFLSSLRVNSKSLKDSLSRIEKIANLSKGVVRFQFDNDTSKVAIIADGHREEIDYDGEVDKRSGSQIAFNVNYLLDALKSDCFGTKDGGEVVFNFNSPTTPATLVPGPLNPQNLNSQVVSYRYLIMPVQVRNH